MRVTNKAAGSRGVPTSDQDVVILKPGDTMDLNLPDKRGPVLEAMIEAGEIEIGSASAKGGRGDPSFRP